MNKSIFITFTLASVFAFSSCKKDDGGSTPPTNNNPVASCNQLVINITTTFATYSQDSENEEACKAYKKALEAAINSNCPQFPDKLKWGYQMEIDEDLDC